MNNLDLAIDKIRDKQRAKSGRPGKIDVTNPIEFDKKNKFFFENADIIIDSFHTDFYKVVECRGQKLTARPKIMAPRIGLKRVKTSPGPAIKCNADQGEQGKVSDLNIPTEKISDKELNLDTITCFNIANKSLIFERQKLSEISLLDFKTKSPKKIESKIDLIPSTGVNSMTKIRLTHNSFRPSTSGTKFSQEKLSNKNSEIGLKTQNLPKSILFKNATKKDIKSGKQTQLISIFAENTENNTYNNSMSNENFTKTQITETTDPISKLIVSPKSSSKKEKAKEKFNTTSIPSKTFKSLFYEEVNKGGDIQQQIDNDYLIKTVNSKGRNTNSISTKSPEKRIKSHTTESLKNSPKLTKYFRTGYSPSLDKRQSPILELENECNSWIGQARHQSKKSNLSFLNTANSKKLLQEELENKRIEEEKKKKKLLEKFKKKYENSDYTFAYQINKFQELKSKQEEEQAFRKTYQDRMFSRLDNLLLETNTIIQETKGKLKDKTFKVNSNAKRKQIQYQFIKEKGIVDIKKDEEEKYFKKHQHLYHFIKEENIDKINPKYKHYKKAKIMLVPKDISERIEVKMYDDTRLIPSFQIRDMNKNVLSEEKTDLKDKKNLNRLSTPKYKVTTHFKEADQLMKKLSKIEDKHTSMMNKLKKMKKEYDKKSMYVDPKSAFTIDKFKKLKHEKHT